MAVVNRTLDSSEQRKVLTANIASANLVTGATFPVAHVPWPCVLEKAQVAAFGVSGSPTHTLVVQRFIVGSGFTAITLSSAQALPAFGTSGSPTVGVSLLASGNTLLNLLPNDILSVLTGGANSALTNATWSVVVRPLQDVKVNFGLI